MKKPKKKHGGGRPSGPPSERMSLYLEKELTQEIRKRAAAQGVTFKDVVTDVLKPVIIGNEKYVALSAFAPLKDKYLVSKEEREQVTPLLFFGIQALFIMRTMVVPVLQQDDDWKKLYAEREHDVIESVRIFLHYGAEEAKAVVHNALEQMVQNGRDQGRKYMAEVRQQIQEMSVVEEGEPSRSSPRPTFRLWNIFAKKEV